MIRSLMVCSLALCAALLLCGSAGAEEGGIQVSNAWSRAALAGRSGGVFLTITDTGPADRVTGASTPVAATAAVHESFSENGVMKMRPVAALPVAPGKPLMLSPGGYHVMLTGLNKPLTQGDSFPLTVTFEHAAPITVTVRVERAGAAGPSGPAGHDMDMSGPAK